MSKANLWYTSPEDTPPAPQSATEKTDDESVLAHYEELRRDYDRSRFGRVSRPDQAPERYRTNGWEVFKTLLCLPWWLIEAFIHGWLYDSPPSGSRNPYLRLP